MSARAATGFRGALLALALLCSASPALGHGLHYSVLKDARPVSLQLGFSSGEPANYAEYKVFGPDDDVEFAKGRSDALGRLAFFPNRPGPWRVQLDAGMGHRLDFELDIAQGAVVSGEPAKGNPKWLGALAGLSLIANLYFAGMLLRKKASP